MVLDWRYEQLETKPYLRGAAFIRKAFQAYRVGWGHDHCAACWATLAEPGVGNEHTVHEGYATTADYHFGADYVWVCVPCFADFRGPMAWVDATPSISG